jgi:two-component system sensor histidine kinase VanS
LKTPIAATSAVLEGMLAGIGDYRDHPKYLRECLNMMNAQGRIISEILEIVKLSGGKAGISTQPVNLLNAVNSTMAELKVLAEKKSQLIDVDIPANAYVDTDTAMFRRALSNILMNAVQNTPDGGEIRVWSEDGADLSIMNTDSRIFEEDKDKLFEPFYRADKARSRSAGRSGLGLAIVKRILDSLQTPFSFENEGRGVVFRMEFKACPPEACAGL